MGFPPPLAGEGREGACGSNAGSGVEDCPLSGIASLAVSPASGGEDKYFQFARVQVCVLQITLITQPLSSAVFGPVMVNEPV